MTNETEIRGNEEDHGPAPKGRTGYDFLTETVLSKSVIISIICLIGAFIIWLLWDKITLIPIYVISSFALSTLWYRPICNWLSRDGIYVDVWDDRTMTLTTYRFGRRIFSDMQKAGMLNTITSQVGSRRYFASDIDMQNGIIHTSWVHELGPWEYHKDMRTLARLTSKVNEVLDDIVDTDALIQVESRVQTMQTMRRHYSDLDSIFYGDLTPPSTDDGGDDDAA